MKDLKERGITLVALVVTIIIMLILAGVTLQSVLGENGLIRQTLIAKEKSEEAMKNEKEDLEEMEWEIGDLMNKKEDEPVPEGKYYSIRNGNEKTYYATLKEAYDATVDNGGKYRGGTIVLEKDVEEDLTEGLEINKTITIDLKLNTMKRNTTIDVLDGTLTVTGEDSGTRVGTVERTTDASLFLMCNNANINVVGNPLIKSVGNAILANGEGTTSEKYPPEEYKSTGTINIQGGYIVSSERSAIMLRGNRSTDCK